MALMRRQQLVSSCLTCLAARTIRICNMGEVEVVSFRVFVDTSRPRTCIVLEAYSRADLLDHITIPPHSDFPKRNENEMCLEDFLAW